jgi:hypothetical protein
VISQSTIERWKRENRKNGNQEKSSSEEEGREEEKEVAFLPTEPNGDA